MRLVDDDGRLAEHLVRELERAGAGAAGRVARERVPRLLPPDPAVALRRAEPVARVQHLRVRRIRELAPDATREDDADREPGNARARAQRDPRRARCGCAGAGDTSRPRSSPAAPATSAAPATTTSAKIKPSCARTERGSPSLVIPGSASATPNTAAPMPPPIAKATRLSTRSPVEHDPRRSRNAGERDAEARVREQERHREAVQQDDALDPAPRGEPQRKRDPGVADEGELVPVVERRAQPRDAPVVAEERGNALREERPADERARGAVAAARASAGRDACAREHAEQREAGIDDGSGS